MRVLMLADGRSIHTVRYQSEMKKQGVDLILASLERGDTVDVLLKKKSVSNSLNYFFVNREIKDLVRKVEPDIINPHFASGYGFSTAVSRVWKNKPIVLHCLGSDILVSPKKSIAHRQKVIYAIEKANIIFTDSEYLKEEVIKLHDHGNIHIIPWGVEKEIADIFDKRSGFLTNRPLNILVPRPHQVVYNNEFVVRSLTPLINDKKISLWFPSWGDFADDFKRLANELCPDGGVELYPFLGRSEYIDFISRFDIYLSAARSDSSPASLIEAMASGMVPVAADIPGIREWGKVLQFRQDDAKSLVAVINKLIDSPSPDLKQVVLDNHNEVVKRGIFSDNIVETIRLMKELL